MSFFLFTPHLSPLCSPPCAALVDPSDPPGALGQLSEHMAHSPDGLDLDHSSSLCHPSGCLHSQAPGWLVPRPTLSLSWLPVNSQPSPPLRGSLARWQAGHSVIYKLVFSLTSLSLLLLWGFLTTSPRKFHTATRPAQNKRLQLAGACRKVGGLLPSQGPSSGAAHVKADLWEDCNSNIMRY